MARFLSRSKIKKEEMKRLIFILLIGFISVNLFSQELQKADTITNVHEISRSVDLGFGYGFDYGGLYGIKLSLSPINHIVLFGAAGHQLAGFGWNVGIAANFFSKISKSSFSTLCEGTVWNKCILI